MALYGKEKIYFLINRLLDEREVTPDGEPIGLHPTQDLHNYYLPQDFINLLSKLEKEENAVKLLNQMPTDQTYGKYLFELLPDFDKYVSKLEDDPKYLDWSGKKPKPKGHILDPSNQVDFTKSKDENKDKYISVGQIEEFEKLAENERNRIMKESLTEKHIKDIREFKNTSLKLIEDIKKNFDFKLPTFPNLNEPHLVEAIIPPNYEAQTVGLLKQLVEKKKQEDAMKSDTAALTITYTNSRQIVLNGVFQLAKPTLNGTNDLVFSHLYANPGKSFSKRQLEAAIGQKISKTLHKIVENLGFKGDLARAFFSVTKNDILFRNPITRDELNGMGLGHIKFN